MVARRDKNVPKKVAPSKERLASGVAKSNSRLPSKVATPQLQSSTARMVSAFVDYSRTECHLAENSVAAYRRDLAKFCEWVGPDRCND